MKTLNEAAVVNEVRGRLAALQADDARQWGTMTAHQAVCHIREAYVAVLEGRSMTAGAKLAIPGAVMKFAALRIPRPWPPGVPTTKELEVGAPAMELGDFEADRAGAIEALERFAEREIAVAHPIFGRMSVWDWKRWGYLHADHHLRQFGR